MKEGREEEGSVGRKISVSTPLEGMGERGMVCVVRRERERQRDEGGEGGRESCEGRDRGRVRQ